MTPGECSSKTLTSRTAAFSSLQISRTCGEMTSLKLTTQAGQRLNVSALNFEHTDSFDEIPMQIRDVMTGNIVVVASQPRTNHVMMSAGNDIEVFFKSQDSNVIIEIEGSVSKFSGLREHSFIIWFCLYSSWLR